MAASFITLHSRCLFNNTNVKHFAQFLLIYQSFVLKYTFFAILKVLFKKIKI